MANSPIQVVLNTSNFIEDIENPRGGSFTDFFEDKDSEFIEHRDSLSQQLCEIKDIQISNEFAPISYAKITVTHMKRLALRSTFLSCYKYF